MCASGAVETLRARDDKRDRPKPVSLSRTLRERIGAWRGRKARLEAQIAFQLECLPAYYLPGIGGGEFVAVGEELTDLLRRHGKLRRSDRVLDLGCGLGRLAIPLQRVLTRGSYEGLDIVEGIIEWNRVNVSGVSPHFGFHHLDVASSTYNPGEGRPAEEVTFPFPDGEFSFAFAFSLFSHLDPAGTCRYLAELARVLRPGGRAVLTFLLLDEEARRRAAESLTDISLPHAWEHGLLASIEEPEAAVAYDAEWILERIAEVGLSLTSPIRWGQWSGRPSGLSYQDVLLLRRPRRASGVRASAVSSPRRSQP
jgi:SAM-dependent methyltransferase